MEVPLYSSLGTITHNLASDLLSGSIDDGGVSHLAKRILTASNSHAHVTLSISRNNPSLLHQTLIPVQVWR